MIRGTEAAKRWAVALGLPEDQAVPCLVAYACARYQGKSFVFKLSQKNRVSLAQALKIGAAMFRWNRALKKDPWGELGRIADFVCEWKKGDST